MIVVGLADQVAHQVLHVAADVAGLAELGGVALDEGHPELGGDQLDDVGLADPRRADHQHIVLDAARQGLHRLPGFLRAADAVEVGADLGGEDRLGLVLLDHVLVQIRRSTPRV